MRELHLSEGATWKRTTAARAARRFPGIIQRLRDSRLHLSAVYLLAPHLSEANHLELLDRATHLSKRDVEKLVVEIKPKPDVRASVRKLPSPQNERTTTTAELQSDGISQSVSQPGDAPMSSQDHAPARAAEVSPLSPSRYKVAFTADQALHDKLRRAQELLGHRVKAGDVAAVVDRALDLLVGDLEKKKNGRTERPRVRKVEAGAIEKAESRYIMAQVRREVAQRDGDRCTFVDGRGRRCGSRFGLEFHHEEPFGMEGPGTVENIRLLCGAHNQLLGEREYGRGKMERMRQSGLGAAPGGGG